jgi:hypothetical protein
MYAYVSIVTDFYICLIEFCWVTVVKLSIPDFCTTSFRFSSEKRAFSMDYLQTTSWCLTMWKVKRPSKINSGANPTTASYNATRSLLRFEKKTYILSLWTKRSSLLSTTLELLLQIQIIGYWFLRELYVKILLKHSSWLDWKSNNLSLMLKQCASDRGIQTEKSWNKYFLQNFTKKKAAEIIYACNLFVELCRLKRFATKSIFHVQLVSLFLAVFALTKMAIFTLTCPWERTHLSRVTRWVC